MAELTDSRMNVAALKRVDPYVKTILETAAHVALYTFNASDNEWEKTEIEGALFVCSRTGEPFNNILIMNRLNMKNLIEPITLGLELQVQNPFLLYRNTQGKIFGIWFYDKEECVKIASTLTKLVKDTSECKGVGTCMKEKSVKNVNGIDIFGMLTKAQEEYNSKSPLKCQTGFVGTPPDSNNFHFSNNTDSTPKSVMDFFAKASSGVTNFNQDKNQVQAAPCTNTLQDSLFMGISRPGPPGLTQLQTMPTMPITIPSPNDVKPLLQRLMSNPAHSVEHIEKQQRSVTPQSELTALLRSKSISNDSNKKISFGQTEAMKNCLISSEVPSVQSNGNYVKQMLSSQPLVENEIGFLRINDTSSPINSVQTQQFFNSSLTQHSPIIGDVPLEVSSVEHRCLSAPHASAMETPTKPALMPPVMFTSSVTKEDNILPMVPPSPNVLPTNTQKQNNINSFQPEPLTKNQLIQALVHLIKNDPDFINQVHEAYVKSFG
uniref:mRNA-decapping enzyme C-terminal domain-containing protein n=1 Tax=Clastoptera arizonana TaxID=38151 RepID=A0A1B6CJ42_9HEMI